MGVVAADPTSLRVSLCSRAGRARVLVAERDVVVSKVADGLHTRPSRWRRPEQPPRLIRQTIGFAVPAPEQEQKRVCGQVLNRMLLGPEIDRVRLARVSDDGLGPEAERAGGC